MPIVNTDIVYRLSVKTGAAGNTTASTPAGSLGKYISTSALDLVVTLNNLFDDVSGDENAASDVEYRCIFVLNDHATLTLQSPVVAWIAAEVAGGADIAIGLDPAGVVAKGSAGAQAATIATEQDAPAGVAFTSPTTKGAGLAIGDIAPGYCQAIWVRRTATNSAAVNNDGVTLRVEGDTAA